MVVRHQAPPMPRRVPANWELRNGMFHVTKGCSGNALNRASYESVKKFVEHFEKMGLKLESNPQFKLIPPWDVKYRPVGGGGQTQMFVPTNMKGLDPNHPWYIPDSDQYEVRAYFSRRPEPVKFWVPDSYMATHGVPVGHRLLE